MNPKTAINLKNASTLWNFCSPTNVFVLWLSGYVGIKILTELFPHTTIIKVFANQSEVSALPAG